MLSDALLVEAWALWEFISWILMETQPTNNLQDLRDTGQCDKTSPNSPIKSHSSRNGQVRRASGPTVSWKTCKSYLIRYLKWMMVLHLKKRGEDEAGNEGRYCLQKATAQKTNPDDHTISCDQFNWWIPLNNCSSSNPLSKGRISFALNFNMTVRCCPKRIHSMIWKLNLSATWRKIMLQCDTKMMKKRRTYYCDRKRKKL